MAMRAAISKRNSPIRDYTFRPAAGRRFPTLRAARITALPTSRRRSPTCWAFGSIRWSMRRRQRATSIFASFVPARCRSISACHPMNSTGLRRSTICCSSNSSTSMCVRCQMKTRPCRFWSFLMNLLGSVGHRSSPAHFPMLRATGSGSCRSSSHAHSYAVFMASMSPMKLLPIAGSKLPLPLRNCAWPTTCRSVSAISDRKVSRNR